MKLIIKKIEIMTFFYLFLQAYIIGMICNTAHQQIDKSLMLYFDVSKHNIEFQPKSVAVVY